MPQTSDGPLVADFFVVAPDEYRELGRLIVHKAAKSGLVSTCWTVEHFDETEVKLSGDQKVLFLGDEDENSPSNVYRHEMAHRLSPGGAYFGWDGSRAIVCGIGVGQQSFRERCKALSSEVNALKKSGPLFELPTPFLDSAFMRFLILGVPIGWLYNRKLVKKLRAAQTAVAAETFITNHLQVWLDNKPLENAK